ncbi:MAG: tetratricopeptide repeat protein [Planctomycetaceae bacterium]|jgi:TolA-binding protein|nr:tetratricopeptide repeat protein [Planctomycetaceae bacterium]
MNIHKLTIVRRLFLRFVVFVTFIVFSFVSIFIATNQLRADTATDLLNSAKQLYNQQKYEQSRVALDDFLRLYPSHTLINEAKFYLADSYLYLKKYDTAINLYSQLSTLPTTDPLTRTVHFRLGEAYYTKGDYATAKTYLTNFVEALPHDSYLQYVLYYLGDIEIANNNAAVAEYYFRENIKLFPNGGRLLESKIGLAIAENQLGKIAESDSIFSELLNNTDPNILEPTTYQYGVALHERGDNQSAINTLNNFLTRWQNSTLKIDVLRVLTRCYISLKDNNKALQTISSITNPSVDDNLMKIRLLIRLKQSDEAENLLTQTEKRTDAPPHADEIAFLKSVLQYFKKNWQNAITLLEQFLLPTYSPQNNSISNNVAYNVAFRYSTTIPRADKHNLSDEVFLHACAYLALAYARMGNKNKADAIANEMNGIVANTNQADLTKVVNDTYERLRRVYTASNEPSTNDSSLVALNPSSSGQWNPASSPRSKGRNQSPTFANVNSNWSNNNNNDNRSPNSNNRQQNNSQNQSITKQPTTTGTDLERFWIAYREFENREWSNAAAQLDQILKTNYFDQMKYITISYTTSNTLSNTSNQLDAATFAKACSMLVISRANLGETDKATAILTAFANKLDSSNTAQQTVLRDTESQLTNIIRNNNTNSANNSNGNFTQQISETEQRRIIKECNSLFNSRRYEQVDTKLQALLQANLSAEILPEVLLLRAKALIAVGNDREGIKLFERIKNEFASSSQYKDALWNLGFYYEMSDDSFRSVEYFQTLVDDFPNYKDIDGALYYVALDDIESGNSRRGISYLLRVYRNYKAGQYWSHATWTLAYEEYKKKNYTQAEIYLHDALLHPPDYAILDRVLYLKGEIAIQKREYKIAAQAFQEVIRLCPESQLIQNADRNLQMANRSLNNIR